MTATRWLTVILVAALAARMALWLTAGDHPQRVFTPDSETYWQLSAQMLHGQFGIDGRPEIFRTPGYPAFLMTARLAEMLDRDNPLPAPWRVATAIQVLLDVLLVLVTYWLGALIVSRQAAVMAAALQAVSPLAVAASCRLLTDSLYAFLFTLSVLLVVGHLRTGRLWPLVVSALTLAVACYVRPLALALTAAIGLVLLFTKVGDLSAPHGPGRTGAAGIPPSESLRRRFGRVALFWGIFAACVVPWAARNAVAADYLGFCSLREEGEILSANQLQHTQAMGAGVTTATAEPAAIVRDPSALPGPEVRSAAGRARGVLLSHPWQYAQMYAKGCLFFWLPAATDVLEVAGMTGGNRDTLTVLHNQGLWAAARHYFGPNPAAIWMALPMAAITAVQFLGMLVAAAGRLRLHMSATAWLLVVIVAASAATVGPFGLARFRVPVEPILNIAAGAGLLALAGKLRRRNTA